MAQQSSRSPILCAASSAGEPVIHWQEAQSANHKNRAMIAERVALDAKICINEFHHAIARAIEMALNTGIYID
jgi:hypothetical protein